jgi:hypothetical protein
MSRHAKTVDAMGPPPDAEMGARSVSLEKDDAARLVGEHAQVVDPELGAKVLRKIDWFLIPAMIVGTFLGRCIHTVVKSIRLWTCLLRQSHPR